MKFFLMLVLALFVFMQPAHAQDMKNPSLIIETIEVPSDEFNRIARNSPVMELNQLHAVSWQVTIDNNLVYGNPNGNAVVRLYDKNVDEKFIEVGMGSQPARKFWVAVQIPDEEGYVVIHRDTERGWNQQAKTVVSYTDRAGMTVNNGARIVVSNLDIEDFAIDSYSVFGMESSTDPPAASTGVFIIEFLSGDPAKNIFAFFPFYVTAVVGALVGVLYLTKRRR